MKESDGALPMRLNAQHYEYISRGCVAQISTARSKADLHQSLASAVHFSLKIFEFTVDLANQCAAAKHAADVAEAIEKYFVFSRWSSLFPLCRSRAYIVSVVSVCSYKVMLLSVRHTCKCMLFIMLRF